MCFTANGAIAAPFTNRRRVNFVISSPRNGHLQVAAPVSQILCLPLKPSSSPLPQYSSQNPSASPPPHSSPARPSPIRPGASSPPSDTTPESACGAAHTQASAASRPIAPAPSRPPGHFHASCADSSAPDPVGFQLCVPGSCRP